VIFLHYSPGKTGSPDWPVIDFIAETPCNILIFDEKVPNQSDYYYKKLGGKGTYPMTIILDKEGIVTHNIKASIHSYEELDGYVQTAISK